MAYVLSLEKVWLVLIQFYIIAIFAGVSPGHCIFFNVIAIASGRHEGACLLPMAVLRGTGLRVQTVVVATQTWGFSPAQIAAAYDLSLVQVNEAVAFYEAHSHEIDIAIAAEDNLEAEIHG
jgi:uncharacterized protein (DUF433 family)